MSYSKEYYLYDMRILIKTLLQVPHYPAKSASYISQTATIRQTLQSTGKTAPQQTTRIPYGLIPNGGSAITVTTKLLSP